MASAYQRLPNQEGDGDDGHAGESSTSFTSPLASEWDHPLSGSADTDAVTTPAEPGSGGESCSPAQHPPVHVRPDIPGQAPFAYSVNPLSEQYVVEQPNGMVSVARPTEKFRTLTEADDADGTTYHLGTDGTSASRSGSARAQGSPVVGPGATIVHPSGLSFAMLPPVVLFESGLILVGVDTSLLDPWQLIQYLRRRRLLMMWLIIDLMVHFYRFLVYVPDLGRGHVHLPDQSHSYWLTHFSISCACILVDMMTWVCVQADHAQLAWRVLNTLQATLLGFSVFFEPFAFIIVRWVVLLACSRMAASIGIISDAKVASLAARRDALATALAREREPPAASTSTRAVSSHA